LWDWWKSPETGEFVTSCVIIVTNANLAGEIHNRLPVVLDSADIGPWLNGTAGTEVLRLAAEDRLPSGRHRGGSTRLALATTIRRSLMRLGPSGSSKLGNHLCGAHEAKREGPGIRLSLSRATRSTP
jgi:hypothetical protein